MSRRYLIIGLPLAALLLVGSGCEESPIVNKVLDLMEKPKDVAEHSVPPKSDDKEKDALAETADSLEKTEKAAELEATANEALGKNPPERERAKMAIEDAIKLRPDDWGLRNQLAVVLAEQDGDVDAAHPGGKFTCDNGKINDIRQLARCLEKEKADLVLQYEASLDRFRKRGQSAPCAVYRALSWAYLDAGSEERDLRDEWFDDDMHRKFNDVRTAVRAKNCPPEKSK